MDLFFFACTACLCASDRVEERALLKKTRKVLGPENFSRRFFSGVPFGWISRFSESVSQRANPTSHPSFWGLPSQVCSVR